MLDKIYKISMILSGIILLLLIVLTAAIGAEELTLKIIGWITIVPLLSSLISFLLIRTKK